MVGARGFEPPTSATPWPLTVGWKRSCNPCLGRYFTQGIDCPSKSQESPPIARGCTLSRRVAADPWMRPQAFEAIHRWGHRFRNTTERTLREVDWSGQTRTSWRPTRTYSVVFGSATRVDPDLSGLERTRRVALTWHLIRGHWIAQYRSLSQSPSRSSKSWSQPSTKSRWVGSWSESRRLTSRRPSDATS
jgi:hypothetical protein